MVPDSTVSGLLLPIAKQLFPNVSDTLLATAIALLVSVAYAVARRIFGKTPSAVPAGEARPPVLRHVVIPSAVSGILAGPIGIALSPAGDGIRRAVATAVRWIWTRVLRR